MSVLFHEDAQAYAQEYQRVRGTFIAHGTTLNAWLEQQGISRQVAYRALKGRAFGRKSIEVRAAVLREAARLQSLHS